MSRPPATVRASDPIALRVSSSFAARARDPALKRWLTDLKLVEENENWQAWDVLCAFPHADLGAALALAARRGRTRELERVLSKRERDGAVWDDDDDWLEALARAARAAASATRLGALELLVRSGSGLRRVPGVMDGVLLDACCADAEMDGPGSRARCVKFLLREGRADANCRNTRQGWKPLHAVAKRGDLESIDALVSAGADVDARYHNGKTCLYTACEWGQPDAARLLIGFGASLTAGQWEADRLYTDFTLGAANDPVSPRDIAVAMRHEDCVRVIDEAMSLRLV